MVISVNRSLIVSRHLGITVQVSNVIMVLLFLVIMEIDSVNYLLEIPATVQIMISAFVSAFCITKLICKKQVSKCLILVSIFFAWLLISTLLNKPENIMLVLHQISCPLGIAVLTEYYLQEKSLAVFTILEKTFVFLVVLDICSIIIFPSGLYHTRLYWDNWLLGYKSARVRTVGIPGIIVAAVNSISKENRLSLKFWLISALMLIDSQLSGATGGLVSILIGVVLIYWVFRSKKDNIRKWHKRFMNPWFILICMLILNYLFTVEQNFSYLEFVITSILDKSMTLSGRTRIWNTSVNLFLESPIIGKGIIDSDSFIWMTGVRGGTQPHNLMLSIMVYMGSIGLVLYFYMLYQIIVQAKSKSPNLTTIVLIGIMLYQIFGLISYTLLAPFHYGFIVAVGHLANYEKKKALSERRST